MNRRTFTATAALGGIGAPLAGFAQVQGAQSSEAHVLELRRYRLSYGDTQQRFHAYWEEAAIPALNRIGVGTVGVFTVVYGTNEPTVYILLVHPSFASVATLRSRLAEDDTFRTASQAFRELPLNDPGFVRYESDLLRSFSGMPQVEVPVQKTADTGRIFELRRYESHSEDAAQRKVQMFNEGGEIAIFRKTGLQPVFFGETIIGRNLPNLTYMLVFDDLVARDAAWRTFVQDPDWAELSRDPYYADTVSAITDEILRPTSYSQL